MLLEYPHTQQDPPMMFTAAIFNRLRHSATLSYRLFTGVRDAVLHSLEQNLRLVTQGFLQVAHIPSGWRFLDVVLLNVAAQDRLQNFCLPIGFLHCKHRLNTQ